MRGVLVRVVGVVARASVFVGVCCAAAVALGALAADATSRSQLLVYAAVRDGQADLFEVGADGSGRHHLTATDRSWEQDPAVSPDGRLLAFSRGSSMLLPGETYVLSAASIWIARADGSRPRRLTFDKTGEYSDRSPQWSPDGRRVAYLRHHPSFTQPATFALYVVGVDGRGRRRLTGGTEALDLDWKPDGRTIALAGCASAASSLCLIEVATGHETSLLVAGVPPASSVSWSPDGRQLAVTAGDVLYVIPARGGRARVLTRRTSLNDVSWAPDARRLAFTIKEPGGTSDIYTIGADGRNLRRLTFNPSDDITPDWRR